MGTEWTPWQALGPAGLVEVGAISDARLAALSPRPVAAGSWWSAEDRTDGDDQPVGATPRGDGEVPPPERLAVVRRVLHEATSVVTWTDGRRRGAFVVADGVVLIDVPSHGLHHLTLAGIATATAVLVIGLDPLDVARHRLPRRAAVTVGGAAGGHSPDTDAGARRSVVHVARVTTGPPPGELVLTVVGRHDGLELVRALPDGRTARRELDRDGVVAAAVALLTGPSSAVAA